jgi:transcriptional regulator with XRE-family HTH domain
MTFGEKIKDLREQRKLSQEELAKEMGLSRRAIQRHENGETHPRDRKLYYKFADFFGVNVNYLLTEDEEFLNEAAIKYGQKGQLQAAEILDQISGLLAGGDMSENDQNAFNIDIQKRFFQAKDITTVKFNPHKNRKKNDGAE